MKLYKTIDNRICKFVHEDKTETVIKYNDECGENSGDKYSVFISSSYGCERNCRFCMLSTKGLKHSDRSHDSIYENTKEAISKYIELNPDMKEKNAKLSWMGMGEPMYDPTKIMLVSLMLNNYIMHNNFAKYIEGIDIGTSLPLEVDYSDAISNRLTLLSNYYPRLFISVGSTIPKTRKFLIGHSGYFVNDVEECISYMDNIGGDVIFHHFFLDGINDSDEEVDALIEFMNRKTLIKGKQLRILRYNECDGSLFQESKRYEEIKERLEKEVENIKFQRSPGKEVLAACGQFVCEMENE